ncbi:MAG: NACHT domain-containing protein, partial [Leptolyngbya sp. SIO3F4]|nr:NACHT domain-containing protein [Leptolyngbya sp. SIO3F4]
SSLSLSWLRRLIRHSPVRQIVIILDCCHSGEFLSLKDEAWQGSDGQSYLFIAASREYEEAYESLGSNYSVLTQALLSGLLPQQSKSGRITSTDLVASITNQLSDEIQQPLFEQGGSEIVITRQSETTSARQENASIISRLKQYSLNFCPYRGIQPFEEKHADYYFGRETLIQNILQTLQQSNLCALVGASGSGKTSLLRAGIMPHLTLGKEIPGSETWLIRYITPGSQPLKSLATAFTLPNQNITVAKQLLQAEELLRHQLDGLVHLVTAAMIKQPQAERFWLIIDQFEELLTPTTDTKRQQEQQQIINGLITALRCPSIPLGIVISLRSDAIDHLVRYTELFSLIKHNQIVLPPMSYQEIRDVIEKPAEKLDLKIDPYLVHNLTLDLTGAPGELALLQNTLYELWRHRTKASHDQGGSYLSLDSYIKLGRLSTMLTDRATTFYKSLPLNEQAATKRIFLSLCDLGEGRFDHSRQVRKSELINSTFSQSLIDDTLQKLVEQRLIVVDKPHVTLQTDGISIPATAWETKSHKSDEVQRWLVANLPAKSPSEDTIELAHKSLVSDWAMLRQWLQECRSDLRQQREIEERAWLWHERGETKCAEYLLGQKYLKEARQFLRTNLYELSTLAYRFVETSQRTVTYQRWQNRGIAVLLPVAMMAGMTVSLVRHQISAYVHPDPPHSSQLEPQKLPSSPKVLTPLLPKHWGIKGFERLTVTSQILGFYRSYPQSELSQLSITELANLMTLSAIMTSPATSPDTFESTMKGRERQ